VVSEINAFRPLHLAALQALADYLWAYYPLDGKTRRFG
jgi:hypothetical protein